MLTRRAAGRSARGVSARHGDERGFGDRNRSGAGHELALGLQDLQTPFDDLLPPIGDLLGLLHLLLLDLERSLLEVAEHLPRAGLRRAGLAAGMAPFEPSHRQLKLQLQPLPPDLGQLGLLLRELDFGTAQRLAALDQILLPLGGLPVPSSATASAERFSLRAVFSRSLIALISPCFRVIRARALLRKLSA